MANTIIIDEEGIARYRFGKRIRMFRWEEIKTIGRTSEDYFTGWVYVSDEERKYDNKTSGAKKMWLDKHVI
ncbi:MAG: hypothetical protein K2K15_01975, partial [Anaeroplasmataceae bacterium]|nr:hypothetical protein [Anaeroplasmataceae bacterium]